MPVTYESDGGGVFCVANNNNAITVPLPATRPVGSVLLLAAFCRLITAAAPTITGYTLLNTWTSGTASGGRIWLYGRICDGTESAPSVTPVGVTGNSGDIFGAGIVCYSGVDTSGGITAILDGTPTTTDASGTTTCTYPALTITKSDSMIMRFLARFQDLAVTFTPTATWNERADLSTTIRTGGQFHMQDKLATASGAQASVTVVPSSTTATRYLAVSLALKAVVVIPPKSTSIAQISLASAGVPTTRTNHIVKLRARKTNAAHTGKINIALYEGGTQRGSTVPSVELTTSFAEYSFNIGDAGAAAITDYSDLQVFLWGYASSGSATVFEVSQLWLEIPEASGTPIASSDTNGTTTEGASVVQRVDVATSDIDGTHVEVATVVALLVTTDVDGTPTEATVLVAKVVSSDTGVGADVAALDATTPKASSDVNGTVTESVTVVARIGEVGAAPSYVSEVLADNPISYWRLGNNVTIHDEKGVSADVTAAGGWTDVGLLTGDADTSILFDGADDSIEIPNIAAHTVYNGSLEIWVKSIENNVGGAYRALICKSEAFGIFMYDNQLMTYDWGGGGNQLTGVFLNDNVTHHVVLTFQSGVAGGSRFYVDGVAVGSSFQITVQQQGQPLTISKNSNSQYFRGNLDEAAIYGTVLSPTRIAKHYEAGTATGAPAGTTSDNNGVTTENASVVQRVSIAGSDTGAGTETTVLVARPVTTDVNGTTTDVATLVAKPIVADINGVVTETSTVAVPVSTSDASGLTADTATLVARPVTADVNGVTSEGTTLVARPLTSDTGAGTDAGSLETITPKASSDINGTTTEAVILVALVTSSDVSGTVTENSAVGVPISASDTGTSSEAATLVARYTVTDTNGVTTETTNVRLVTADTSGVSSDAQTLVARYTVAETNSSVLENAGIGTIKSDSDAAGATTETATVTKALVATGETSTGVDNQLQTYRPTVTDVNGITTDNASVVAFVQKSGTDSGTSTETATVSAIIGGGFSPDLLTGLAVWIDASQLGLADGADVTSWPNLGSGGVGAVVGTPNPKLKTNVTPSGGPVVNFAANEGRLRMTSSGLTGACTIVYVTRMRGPSSNGRVMSSIYPPPNIVVGYHGGLQDVGYSEGWLAPGGSTVTTDWKLYSWDQIPTVRARLFLDGIIYSQLNAANIADWNNSLAISGYEATGPGETCDCDVAEIVAYDRTLSAVDRQQVENYLREKWLGAGVVSSDVTDTNGATTEVAAVTAIKVSDSDAGIVTETAQLTIKTADTSGVSTEIQTLVARLTVNEINSSVIENAGIGTIKTGTDAAGATTETATVRVFVASTSTGAGVDNATLKVVHTQTQSGTFLDNQQLVAKLTVTDTLVGIDVAVATFQTFVSVAEFGTVVDTATMKEIVQTYVPIEGTLVVRGTNGKLGVAVTGAKTEIVNGTGASTKMGKVRGSFRRVR